MVGPVIAGYLGVFGTVALTPAGFAALIAAIVGMGVLASLSFVGWQMAGIYLDDHKAEIVCALYETGDAVEARTALAGFLEDAVQSIEWTGLLAPLAPELAAFMGIAMGAFETNGVVNILFELTADVAYPDAGCDCAQGLGWSFLADEEGWTYGADCTGSNTYTPSWQGGESGSDPYDPSWGRLQMVLNRVESGNCKAYWIYWFPVPFVAHTGDEFNVDTYLYGTSGYGHVYNRIKYEDNSEDTYHIEARDFGWENHPVQVSSGNNGKNVTAVYVMFDLVDGSNQQCTFALDHARYIPA
jgi:hypothetical protein